MSLKLPDPKRFIKAYVIKEAMLSSSIEGIHTTLIDVFTHVIDENSKPNKETQLVLNYTKAIDAALSLQRESELLLTLRVILQAHQTLMSSGDGDKASPGQFRKQSVRVGELTPAPASEVPNLMSDLERYINEPSELPPLIQAGLAHVQFETIHPFLDGNGRIGRLLIVLMLIDHKILNSPILYPSYYFKKHHLEYYQRLDLVRSNGDFEGWLIYYLKAIRDSAIDANLRAKEIESLEIELKNLVLNDSTSEKNKEASITALSILFTQPIINATELSRKLENAYNTSQSILTRFTELEITSESPNKRNKIYRFDSYLALLEKAY
jgi:Fic family protein